MPEIQMPKLSDTMTEGTLVAWKKKKGDKVSTGEVLAEIETDKATMEWESPEDGTLTEIYLQEGDIDRALQLVQKESGSVFWGASSLRLEVAQAAERPRPRAALEIYLPLVKQNINGRNRESYRNAAGYLSRIRKLYQALNEENNWRQLITKIRQEHKNLPALQDELKKAGL